MKSGISTGFVSNYSLKIYKRIAIAKDYQKKLPKNWYTPPTEFLKNKLTS